MKRTTHWLLLWVLLVSVAASSLVVVVTAETLALRIIALATIAVVGMCSYVLLFRKSTPQIFWDEEMGILLLFGVWNVEARAARLLRSVPIGIDVSYSAKKVMQAMSERLPKSGNCRLDFVVHRPVGNSSTRAGFIVARSKFIGLLSKKRVNDLCDSVFQDATVLESAMRSSYPHTPVERGELEDVRMIMTGGTSVVV